jgi:hypothetical protein
VTAKPISDSASVVACCDLLATEFGSEIVVLNLRDGVYYGLEDVGVRIWQLLKQPVTVAAIRDTIVSEYDVEAACCERDIRTLLGELAARGLVEIRERL